MADPTKIQRLVFNLLDNASRYAPEHSTIEVRVTKESRRVSLCVSNAGPPIPPELRERVFEPYYRVPGSGSDGSGLGLAIVKEVAAQHRASVRLTPRDDSSGTMVRVTFPTASTSTKVVVQHAITSCDGATLL